MDLTCPKCSKKLPKVETLKYRFCPHCGAGIATGADRTADASLTLPPDSVLRKPKPTPARLSSGIGQESGPGKRFNDQTVEHQPVSGRAKPELKPPDTPPPSGFFRSRAAKEPPSGEPSEKAPPPEDKKASLPARNRTKIMIAVLILIAVIILITGGLLTF